MLANRLKPILPYLIDPSQGEFVAGRGSVDNVVVVFETIHSIVHRDLRITSTTDNVSIKIDMSKAYHRMSWEYLEFMLLKFNFLSRFIPLIMRCATSTSFFISCNGTLSHQLYPKKRLRQQDPLSPLLFITCMDGLSGLISKFSHSHVWKGIEFGNQSP